MGTHEKFNFKSVDAIREKSTRLGLSLQFSDDFSPLGETVTIGKRTAPNRIAVLPMEGCDSEPDGSPSELVERRYVRFALGGAGLIWWEANAVVEEGKANELQMMLTEKNIGRFRKLLDRVKFDAKQNNPEHAPLHILQLTHSGRYSRPWSHKLSPVIPQHDPILDPRTNAGPDTPLVTDAYLDDLVGKYVSAAHLAREAGFDGVDVKACHRYLLSELLASHTREGKYGGSYENRSRLILDIIRQLRKECGEDFIIASRFNIFDAHPYPYGFGCDKADFWKFDPAEPVRLVKDMCAAGADLLSNSAGNPYYIYPQVTRPFDTSSLGVPVPEEHPLESIERLFEFNRVVQEAAGSVPVIGNGYTWLRQFIPHAGAANIKNGICSMVGLGRSSIAYPDAPRDILTKGQMVPGKCCITCSKCTQIMRDHGRTGCVIRDSAVYLPLYNEARKDAEAREKKA